MAAEELGSVYPKVFQAKRMRCDFKRVSDGKPCRGDAIYLLGFRGHPPMYSCSSHRRMLKSHGWEESNIYE